MNVLAIGNSFSQDATRYLHQIAKADDCKLLVTNLYIGGCPLNLHFRNMLTEKKAYFLESNGEKTGFHVSLKEALLNRDWDYVTMQQVSTLSGDYQSYQPYLNRIAEYVKELVPKAKLVIHQTWAYEEGSERLVDNLGYAKQHDMYNDLKAAYEKAAKDINADMIIPSGDLFAELQKSGIKRVYRDAFHASLGPGRYALGLLWYKCLTGNSVTDNDFSYFDEPVLAEEVEIAKRCVENLIK